MSVSNLMDLHIPVANLIVVYHAIELGQFGRKIVMSGSENVSRDVHFIIFGVVAKADLVVAKAQGIF